MKKIYYVVSNGYDYLITDDGEIRRTFDVDRACDRYSPREENGNIYNFVINEKAEVDRVFVRESDDDFENVMIDNVKRFLATVEDDSSWEEHDETVEELTDGDEIIAEAEANC